MIFPTSLDEYEKILIQDIDPSLLPHTEDPEYATLAVKLIKSSVYRPFMRRRLIKRMILRLTAGGFLRNVRVRFPLFSKSGAYMRDSGTLTLPMRLLTSQRGDTVFKLLMHEAAHLLLSKSDGYSKLLSLDKQFFRAHGRDSDEIIILSPVELYATRVSVALMSSVMQSARDGSAEMLIEKQISLETKKLEHAKNIFLKETRE